MQVRRQSNEKQVRAVLEAAAKIQTRVGFFANQTYNDGTPVAYVATIQEFGYGPIPSRSFMRLTATVKAAEWAQNVRGALASALKAGSVEKLINNFAQVGAVAAADISYTISQINQPMLAPATLKARQSRQASSAKTVSIKPLVDSGKLIQSPTYAVAFK